MTAPQLWKRWKDLWFKWNEYGQRPEQDSVDVNIQSRLNNDEKGDDLMSLYTPVCGFKEQRYTVSDETGKLVQDTMEFFESDTGFAQLRLPALRDNWDECRTYIQKLWLFYGYNWFHDRQKKTVSVRVPMQIKQSTEDNKVGSSVPAPGTSSSSTQMAEIYVTTSLGTLLGIVISFIDTHIHQPNVLHDEELRKQVTGSKSAEQLIDNLCEAWNHIRGSLSDDAKINRHVSIFQQVSTVISHWLWHISCMKNNMVSGLDAWSSTEAKAEAQHRFALTRVVDTDPDYVGDGVRGLRPINEAMLTQWYMFQVLHTVYEEHKILELQHVLDQTRHPSVQRAWIAFLEAQLDIETTNHQQMWARNMALLTRARLGARGLVATRESQAEQTVEPVVCVQRVHFETGTQWVKECKLVIKDTFCVLDNPECHEMRRFAVLMFVDRTFQAFFSVSFLKEFVVFEWDLFQQQQKLHSTRVGIARRRPLLVFVLGRFWIQLARHPDCNSDLPVLVPCPNVETAILAWFYCVIELHQGVASDGVDLRHCTEFPFAKELATRFMLDNAQT